jgi:predicted nucleotidyltransferase
MARLSFFSTFSQWPYVFFGSAPRGEMGPHSDVDMLIEFLPDADIDLVDEQNGDRLLMIGRIP